MIGNDDRKDTVSTEVVQIANMSKLDFLLLLWEARIVGEDCVEANT